MEPLFELPIRLRPARLGRSAVIVLAAVIGLMLNLPARADGPAPSQPCPGSFDSEPVARLVEQVKDFGEHGWSVGWTASCASEALSRKGENIIPVLIRLMETHQSAVESLALDAVCGPGHSGATAVGYIEHRLRAGGLPFAVSAYGTLACLGKRARPAIPLLIDKSLGIATSFPSESDLATETLGDLAQYDPGVIVPHLIRLLDQPAHAAAAARALEKIGKPAHSAAEALHRNLMLAVDAGQDEVAAALISALGRLGSPQPTVAILIPLLDRSGEAQAAARALGAIGPQAKPAVTALIKRLGATDTGWRERGVDICAAMAIDPHSPVVLKAVLDEMTRDDSGGVNDFLAAGSLANVKPLPPELAPALIADIERRDPDDGTRYLLEKALAHTGTKLRPAVNPRLPPRDVSDLLGDGLWALAVQPQPIEPDELVKLLHLNLNDYLQEGGPVARTWRRKSVRPRDPSSAAAIYAIDLSGVRQSDRVLNSSAASTNLPDTQTLHVSLDDRFCISADEMRARIGRPGPATSDPAVVLESPNSALRDSGVTLRFEGDHSADKSQARYSEMPLGPSCGRDFEIRKAFDPDYWSHICPLAYDRAFTESVIIPAVEKQFGSQFGQFEFDTPEIRDLGWRVNLIYKEVVLNPVPDWQAVRLSLVVDRCSHSVSDLWKYMP